MLSKEIAIFNTNFKHMKKLNFILLGLGIALASSSLTYY